ncbi:MAG TPA: hypothetical protein VGJ86_08105 [Acidimicrobiales bacterium]|jgi:hypothetical protein
MNDDEREPDRLAEALTAALSRRAAEIRSRLDIQARAAVDQRLRQRARNRNVRRGTLAAVVLVAAALAGSLIVARRDNAPEIAVDQGDDAPLEAGLMSDDPARFDLPRIVVDPVLGLAPAAGDQPVAVTRTDMPEPLGFAQMQVFRSTDGRVPVIFAPWDPTGADDPLPVPGVDGTVVDINGVQAALQGQEGGWESLSWLMDDGTKARLYAFGVPDDQLLQVAKGLRRPESGADGYEIDTENIPAGLVEQTSVAPAVGDVRAMYSLSYSQTGADEPQAGLIVGGGTRERSEERLFSLLLPAQEVEPIGIMDGTGILITNAGPDSWTVLWSPGAHLGAELRIDHATRADVDTLIAALRTVDRTEWLQLLSDARANG